MIVSFLFKGSLILIFAWATILVMRKKSPAQRYCVWTVSFACLIAMPLLNGVLPAWNVITMNRTISDSEVRYEFNADTNLAVKRQQIVSGQPISPSAMPAEPNLAKANEHQNKTVELRDQPESSYAAVNQLSKPILPALTMERFSAALFSVWAVGFGVLFGRLILSSIMLIRLERRRGVVLVEINKDSSIDFVVMRSTNDPTDHKCCRRIACTAQKLAGIMGLHQPFRLVFRDTESSPFVWGAMTPRIFLPDSALSWDQNKLESVLTHELAHIQRQDLATHWMVQLAFAVHWPNPLVWFAASRLSAEREAACDDLVLGCGIQPNIYAKHLLEIASGVAHQSAQPSSLAVTMARNSDLQARLQRVLSSASERSQVTWIGWLLCCLIAFVIVVPVSIAGAVQPKQQQTETPAAATDENEQQVAARELFHAWWAMRRLGESDKIPAGLVKLLADEIDLWISLEKQSKEVVDVDQLDGLLELKQLMNSGQDLAPSDAKAIVNQISQHAIEPLKSATQKINAYQKKRFQDGRIREYLNIHKLVWGKPASNGLRMGIALKEEDQTQNYLPGSQWNRLLFLENTGDETIVISSSHRFLHSMMKISATDENGKDLPIVLQASGSKETEPFPQNCILAPKQSCTFGFDNIGIGKCEEGTYVDVDQSSNIKLTFENFSLKSMDNPIVPGESVDRDSRLDFYNMMLSPNPAWSNEILLRLGGVIPDKNAKDLYLKMDGLRKQNQIQELTNLLADMAPSTPFTETIPGFSVDLSFENISKEEGEVELKGLYAELFEWDRDRLERVIASVKADERENTLAILGEKKPARFNRMMRLAQAWPQSETAMNAALLTMKSTYGLERDVAMEVLLGNHIESSRIAEAIPYTRYTSANKRWARQILAANSNPVVVAHAKWVLGPPAPRHHDPEPEDALNFYSEMIRDFGDMPRLPDYWGVPHAAPTFGKLALAEIRKIDGRSTWSVGAKLPDFEGVDLEGAPISLKDYRGKTTLIVYWATWCGPCLAMAKTEKKLLEHYGDRPFDILGVCGDFSSSEGLDAEKERKFAAAIRQRASQHGITWRSIRNVMHDGERVSDLLGFPSLPYTLLVDGEGIVRSISFINGSVEDPAEQAKLMMSEIERVLGGDFEESDTIVNQIQMENIAEQANRRGVSIWTAIKNELDQDETSKARKLIENLLVDTELRQMKPHVLNYVAWSMYEYRENKVFDDDHLDLALRAAAMAVQARPEDPMILDTLAHLLHANGKLDQAIEIQQKAVENLKGDFVDQIKNFLKQLKREKKNG